MGLSASSPARYEAPHIRAGGYLMAHWSEAQLDANQDNVRSVHIPGSVEVDSGMDIVGLKGKAGREDVIDADTSSPGLIAVHVLSPGVLGTDAEWAVLIGRPDIPLPIQAVVAIELSEPAPYLEI